MRALYATLSRRYWQRCLARAALGVATIALGVATWVATSALNDSLEKASRSAVPLAGAADLYVSNGDAGVPWALAEPLAGILGVRAVQPLVSQRVTLPDLAQRPALLLGIDLPRPDDPAWDVKVRDVVPQGFAQLILFGRKQVLVGRELAQALPRDAAQVSVLIAGQVRRLSRAGTIEGQGPAATLSGSVLVMEWDTAAALLGRPDLVSRLDLSLEPDADWDAVRRRVEAELGGKARVSTPEGQDRRYQEMLTGLKVGFALCGAGALVVGLFLISNTLAVSVVERRHDIGILRSLGATRGQVGRLFVGEALVLGLGGTAFGLPLGLGLAALLLGPMRQALSDVFLPLPMRPLHVTAGSLISAAAAGIATALLAVLAPAIQAAAEGPIDALRRAPSVRGLRDRRLQAAGSLGLAVLGLACLALQERLPPRLGTYGGLVLVFTAALLAVPLATGLVARLMRPVAGRLLGIPGRLAADNLIRAPGRTGLVIAALAAGVALLFQTGGLIRSNEEAVAAWVDQSIAGDLFVTSGGPLSASGQILPMAETVGQRLGEGCPGMRVVPMSLRRLDWRQAGRATRVLLLALDAQSYAAANTGRAPPLPDLELYRRLSVPGTVLVSENFAVLNGIRAGDTIHLPGVDGPVPLRVLGTVVDYSCNRGTIIVDRAQYGRQFGADLVDVFDVYLTAAEDPEAVRQVLLQAPWAAGSSLAVLTRDELRRHVLGMVGRLYGLAYTQEVVVGMVAVLGVVAALLISVLQRRRELGLLRAIGATRAQVFRSVLAEALLMGASGAALGLAIGLPLEWYTVRILLVEEAGFVCPVRFPWAAAVVTIGLALAGSAVAAQGPALKALRPRIVEAIAYE